MTGLKGVVWRGQTFQSFFCVGLSFPISRLIFLIKDQARTTLLIQTLALPSYTRIWLAPVAQSASHQIDNLTSVERFTNNCVEIGHIFYGSSLSLTFIKVFWQKYVHYRLGCLPLPKYKASGNILQQYFRSIAAISLQHSLAILPLLDFSFWEYCRNNHFLALLRRYCQNCPQIQFW